MYVLHWLSISCHQKKWRYKKHFFFVVRWRFYRHKVFFFKFKTAYIHLVLFFIIQKIKSKDYKGFFATNPAGPKPNFISAVVRIGLKPNSSIGMPYCTILASYVISKSSCALHTRANS